jgi:hypothetical protein
VTPSANQNQPTTNLTLLPPRSLIQLPFSNFMLTKEGRVSTHQRTMDGIVRLQVRLIKKKTKTDD